MDLDKEITLLQKEVFRRNDVDIADQKFLQYAGIYSDVLKETERISPKTTSERIDFNSLLQGDGKEFVEKIYRQILHREPDSQGMQNYLTLLESHQITKEDVITSIGLSKEASEKGTVITGITAKRINPELLLASDGEQFVKNSYRWILGREAGTEEINEKVRILTSGMDKESLLFEISQSEEGQRRAVELPGLDKLIAKRRSLNKMKKMPGIQSVMEVLENERRMQDALQMERIQKLKDKIEEQNHMLSNYHRELTDTRKQLEKLEQQYYKLCRRIENDSTKNILGRDRNNIGGDTAQNESCSDYNVIDYFDFEDHFRGSREEIKKAQEIYLPYFAGCSHVLDLGCGRGEFTELLVENGIGVTGVDFYQPYVQYMEEKGLPVILADAVEYLHNQEVVDGIFLGQVVEHITVEKIVEICSYAYEKLPSGAYFIMETPNPMSLAIFMSSFYLDPSHQKPVHPYTLRYLVQKAGFEDVQILFTESSRPPFTIPPLQVEGADDFNRAMKQIENYLYGSQDYAIIARR